MTKLIKEVTPFQPKKMNIKIANTLMIVQLGLLSLASMGIKLCIVPNYSQVLLFL